MFRLPLAMFACPVVIVPVPVMFSMLALPADEMVTLAFALTMTFELPVIRLPAVATFMFEIRVVEATVIGAVPVARVEFSCPVMFAVEAFSVVTLALPDTVRLLVDTSVAAPPVFSQAPMVELYV